MKNQSNSEEATLYVSKAARDMAQKKKTKSQIALEIEDLAQDVRHLAHTNPKATRDELIAAHKNLQMARFNLTPEGKTFQILSIPK